MLQCCDSTAKYAGMLPSMYGVEPTWCSRAPESRVLPWWLIDRETDETDDEGDKLCWCRIVPVPQMQGPLHNAASLGVHNRGRQGVTCRGGVAQSARKASKDSTGAGVGGGARLAAAMLSTWHEHLGSQQCARCSRLASCPTADMMKALIRALWKAAGVAGSAAVRRRACEALA